MIQRTLRTRLCRCAIVATSLVALLTSGGTAAVITFPLSIEYSGGTPPAGSVPWLTAVFDDEGTPGDVKLKLIASNLTGSEFVSKWTFNLNPTLLPADISFSAPTKTGGNGFADPTVSKLVNAFSAGPDGNYDIEFSFATSNAGGGTQRFGAGEAAEYTITGTGSAASLVASDFAYKSQNGNTSVGGPFYTGAHVQSIGGDDSGWITVQPGFDPFGIPEPASLVLLGFAVAVAGLKRPN